MDATSEFTGEPASAHFGLCVRMLTPDQLRGGGGAIGRATLAFDFASPLFRSPGGSHGGVGSQRESGLTASHGGIGSESESGLLRGHIWRSDS